jgi:predicted ATPase/class 3 adenylate cyclase
MAALPTGTVTFLFTDIEGSTRLLRELGVEAYERALRHHRAVLRTTFEEHGGVEIDTQGDGFFVAFARATDALGAAAGLTESLQAGPIRVRVGVHTGEPLLTDEGYVGIDVHRAARIATVGYGGQVLVSQTTCDLVPDAQLRDLGEHRLKDLTRPERLFQLGDGEFPALKSLNRTNLPVTAGPLLGREHELMQITSLIRDGTRLVTLTGPGGSGKTRLGLQVAAELVGDYADGIFFVALAPLREASLVPGAVASAMGLSPADDLSAVLSSKRALLVLDNAEHLDVAQLVASLLDAARETVLLVTSRAPLHLSLEREFTVGPLAEAHAVELFVARASAIGEMVAPDEAVASICRRLDSLPLAVELAAARTKLLSPRSLLDRLERALPLLTGGARDAPERQRTLHAAIQWSYELLSEDMQAAFRRLAVFRGGFAPQAAAAVADADLDALAVLVDQSLLKRGSADRFLMLETIREFALDRLDETDGATATRLRHGRWYREKVRELTPGLRGSEAAEVAAWHETETGNLWAALDELVVIDADEAFMLAYELRSYWYLTGRLRDPRRWLQNALEASGPPTVARGRAFGVMALCADGLGDIEAAEDAVGEALRIASLTDDATTASLALELRAWGQASRGRHERAAETALEAVRAAERSADEAVMMRARTTLAVLLSGLGRFDEAREQLETELAARLEIGDEINAATARASLGTIALWQHDYARAREYVLPALETARRFENDWAVGGMSFLLGMTTLAEGQMRAALSAFVDGLECAARAADAKVVVDNGWGVAAATASTDPSCAAQLRGRWLAYYEAPGIEVHPVFHEGDEQLERTLRASLDNDALEQALEAGRSLTQEATVELALRLAQRARI